MAPCLQAPAKAANEMRGLWGLAVLAGGRVGGLGTRTGTGASTGTGGEMLGNNGGRGWQKTQNLGV